MEKSNNKSIVILVTFIVVFITAIIVGYRLRLFLWYSNNEKEFDILVDDIRNMKEFPLEEISYQDGEIRVPQLGHNYQTGEYYILSVKYDGPKVISEEKTLIDYNVFTNKKKEIEVRIKDDINSIKNRIWTGDNKLLSYIYARWDQKGNILVYIRVNEKKSRDTEKIWVTNYVYKDKGFYDESVEPKGEYKKIKENWYIQEAKIDVG